MADGSLYLEYLHMILDQEKIKPSGGRRKVIGDYKAFQLGDLGACQFAKDTLLLRDTVEITTVADQREYNLPPDFINIARKSKVDGRTQVISYLESGATDPHLIDRVNYDEFWDYDTGDTEDIPNCFDILPAAKAPASVTGTTTSAGSMSDGISNLVNSGATFTDGSDLVYPRYPVYNTKSGKDYFGIVIEQTSDTALKTCMFKEGASKSWASGDTYRIQSACKFKLIFDYATATASETITVDYYCLPDPVYSKISMWGFPDPENVMAIAIYAAWLQKFRLTPDSVPHVNMESMRSDKLYAMYRHYVRQAIDTKNAREMDEGPSKLMGIL